jgi:flavin reductase (DIM6/NTAB) family NADH-FMN oxidoreductase RutF
VLIDLAGISRTAAYHLMTQLVIPRPIAWVLSDNGLDAVGDEDRWNLAPFSYFNAVASAPPMVMVSIGDDLPDRDKDTLVNVTSRPHHTIAIPGHAQMRAVQASAATLPRGVSELGHAGVEPVAWDWPTPRPSGARIALGCVLDEVVPVAGGTQSLVLSRVERVWVDDDAVARDAQDRVRIDSGIVAPLARLGAGLFAAVGPAERPTP